MPYVGQETRTRLMPLENAIKTAMKYHFSGHPGEINYIISIMTDEYLSKFGLSYSNINLLTGTIECAKLEIFRRIAAPYEDKKLEENGDVFVNTGKTHGTQDC